MKKKIIVSLITNLIYFTSCSLKYSKLQLRFESMHITGSYIFEGNKCIQLGSLYKSIIYSRLLLDVKRLCFKNQLLGKVGIYVEKQSQLKTLNNYSKKITARYDKYINEYFFKGIVK